MQGKINTNPQGYQTLAIKDPACNAVISLLSGESDFYTWYCKVLVKIIIFILLTIAPFLQCYYVE